ncbi:helix-turn-helix domain-containing protein [Azotobacter beijerinckii]|nr:helix-turn-helix domain-containing protein [Azotobacter beijerinckii]
MKFVSPLSDTDLQALMEDYVHAEKPALRRRAHAIVLSHKRYSINQISDILAVTRETVSLWFDAWEADGLEGLRDKARPGRPAVYDALDRERLQALVAEHPHQIKAVQARLQQETGKSSCTATVKRALKKAMSELAVAWLLAPAPPSSKSMD